MVTVTRQPLAHSTNTNPKTKGQHTDILITQLMRQPDLLRLMLDTLAINNSPLEVLHNGLMNGVTEVLNRAPRRP